MLCTVLLGLCVTSMIPENTGAVRICVQGFQPTAVLRPLGSSLEEQKDGVSIKPLSDIKARFAFNVLNLNEDFIILDLCY